MDLHMAAGALLILRIQHIVRGRLDEDTEILAAESACAVMAFQTNGEDHRRFSSFAFVEPCGI